MKRTASFATKTRLALAITMLAVLSACGGGGGDGPPAPTLIDLTAANRDIVAHAAAGSLLALGTSTAVPVLGGAGPVGMLWRGIAGADRERPKAVVSGTVPCDLSGSATLTLNDLNGSGYLDVVGESATVVFNQCQNDAYYVMNGTEVVTAIAVDSLRFDMSQLSQNAVNGRHGMMIDGSLKLVCAELGPTSVRCTSTASGPVIVSIQTHQFNDTVTLHNGFVEESTRDNAMSHTVTTLRGTIDSVAAGGAVSVTTHSAFGALDSDAYPHEGAVRVSGARGVMRITALPAAQVRLELDAENDGNFESTATDTWDWLL